MRSLFGRWPWGSFVLGDCSSFTEKRVWRSAGASLGVPSETSKRSRASAAFVVAADGCTGSLATERSTLSAEQSSLKINPIAAGRRRTISLPLNSPLGAGACSVGGSTLTSQLLPNHRGHREHRGEAKKGPASGSIRLGESRVSRSAPRPQSQRCGRVPAGHKLRANGAAGSGSTPVPGVLPGVPPGVPPNNQLSTIN
jgi:hypothetical protein